MGESVKDVLERLAKSNTSSEHDSKVMQYALRKIGFGNAVVTSGVVYLEGRGTIENPPEDIHTYAQALIKSA